MAKFLPLPNGDSLKVPDDMTYDEAIAKAKTRFPELFGTDVAAPKSGFMPALKAGVENIKGDIAAVAGRSGIMDLAAAEKYRAEKQKRAAEIHKPTEDNWIESPLTKAMELAGGSIPYMVAPVVAGAGAAALGAPALVGAGAAGLASAAQFTGSNLSRQLEEDKTKKLGETDLIAAELAAVPQAVLDMVSFKLTPGIRNMIFKGTGKKLSEEAAQNIAQQGLKQVAADYAKATGKTMAAEGLTEAGQQVFERMQAGLDITDEKARQEYFDNFIGGAVLGGMLAPAGRFSERGKIKGEQAKAAAEAEQKRIADAQAAAEAEQAAKRASPDYIPGLLQQSEQYTQQIKALGEAAKGAKSDDPVTVAAAKQAKADLQALKGSDEYRAHLDELQAAAPQIQEMRAQQAKAKAEADAAAQAEKEAKLNDPALQEQLHGQFQALNGQIADLDKQIDAATRSGDTAAHDALDTQYAALVKQREELQGQLGPRPQPTAAPSMEAMQARLEQLVGTTTKNGFPKAGELTKARREGRMDDYNALKAEMQTLRQQIAEPTRARDAVQRQIEAFKAKQEVAPAPAATEAPAAPTAVPENLTPEAAKQWLLDRRDAARDAQRTPLNPNVTEQRTLPLTANPVQYTSAATTQRREQTLEGLKNEFSALVRSARVQRVNGKVDPVLQEQITAKADEIRDFQSAIARQGVPRGQATAEMAPELAGTQMPEKLPPSQPIESTERTITPEKATEEDVRTQLGQLPDDLAPQDDALVAQITRELPALRNAGMPAETVNAPSIEGVPYDKVTADLAPTRALDDVAAYLYKLRTGNDATAEAAQVREHLARAEQGKRSETQTTRVRTAEKQAAIDFANTAAGNALAMPGVKLREEGAGNAEAMRQAQGLARTAQGMPDVQQGETAIQEDLFADTELHGTIFNSYAEFENYLAGDAVKEMRKNVGRTLATAARLQREIAPMEAKVAELRAYLSKLQDVQAFTISAGDASVAKAQAKHQAAVDALQGAVQALEAKLDPQRNALQQALSELSKAQALQAKISDSIAKNAAKFNRDPGLQAAAAKVAAAQAAHAEALSAIGARQAKMQETVGRMTSVAQRRAGSAEHMTELYNNVVAAINEQRAMLEKYAKNSHRLKESTILAYLNRDLQLVLRLRDAEQTVEKAHASVDAARTLLNTAREELQALPETQQTLREAKQGVSTAQGVLTKARNRAMHARTREAEAVKAASDEARAAQQALADKKKAVQEARDARAALPLAETQAQREDADAAARKAANEQAWRLASVPGVQVSHTSVRAIMAEVERLPERIRALDAAANNEDASQAARNKAKYAAADMRERAKIMHGLISNEPTMIEAASTELDARIADFEEKVDAKQAAVNEPGKAASTIRSRRKELSELRTELNQLKRLRRLANNRATFAPVGTNKMSTRTLADTLENVQDKIRSTEDPNVKAALQKQADGIQAELDKRDEAEQRLTLERGINLETEGTTGKLPERTAGPLVKKAVQAGTIRTGDTTTVGERAAGSRNKIQQGGKKRGITGAQAMKQSAKDVAHEQALLKLSELEDLKERNDAALAKARADKDAAKIAKYEGFDQRLKEGLTRAQKRVDDTVSTAADAAVLDDTLPPVVFRTATAAGPGMKVQNITNIANKMMAEWTNTPPVRVVQSVADLPAHIREQAASDQRADIPGVFDPTTETVYLVADGLHSPEDVILTVAHEVSGHYGLRDLLGSGYAKMMNDIYNTVPGVKADADARMAKTPSLTREIAVEEILADRAESQPGKTGASAALSRVYYAVKAALRNLLGKIGFKPDMLRMTDAEVGQIVANARRHVKRGTPGGPKGGHRAASEQATRAGSAAAAYRTPTYETTSALGKMSDMITAKPTSPLKRLGHNAGLSIEMWGVDMRAPLIKALSVAGEKALNQATYYVRKADALMNHVYASLSDGPLQLVKTSKGNFEIKAGNGPSMKVFLEAVKGIKGVSPEDKMGKLQAYMAAQRAERVGWDKLNFANAAEMQKQAAAMKAELAVDPEQKAALEKARKVYNDINKGTIGFLADSGYISKAKAAELLQHGDYVPFYRVRANGVAELVMGETAVIHVGDLRTNKFLAPLVGDDQKLLPLNESLVRNTMLLTDMALKNLAAKDVAYTLQKIGVGKIRMARGEHAKGPDVVHFRQEPNPADPHDTGERYMRINTSGTAVEHIPSDMLVQSLEGSFSTLPAGLKAAAWFGDILRSGVTRNPMYIARQLFRDPLAATFTGGLDSGPIKAVFKSLSNYVEHTAGRSKEGDELLRKGLIHSGIFTGDIDDINKMMLQLTKGDEGAFKKTLAWWDKAAMNADAATRIQMYKDARAKGMDEMEAELAAMEMMNFNKRGLSPTVQYAARMIPFLNAQMQGLNVLYKAMTGNMPQNEKLAIKEKFYRRAITMAMFTVGYAMAMEDDDTYKNARARDRYNNWFLPSPTGGEHIKIPIPFEVGLLFKALPEALMDSMRGDLGAKEVEALRQAFIAQIPGASSYGIPQAIKPVIEVVTNHNFLTDREIETKADLGKTSTERFGPGTTELAKEMSKIINAMGKELSPKQIDHLIGGYLGSLPVIVARLTNGVFAGTEGATRPTERASDSPIYGALFQRELGGGPVDAAYAQEEAVAQAKKSYDSMIADGRKADAAAFKEDVLNVLGSPELAKNFKSKIDLLQKADKAARIQIKDPDALRARLDVLERQKHEASRMYLDAVKRIAR